MGYFLFVRRFLIYSCIGLLSIFGFIVIIDPYGVTGYNVLNIQNKIIRDNRIEKNNIFNNSSMDFDNIILGSSRAESLNPLYLSTLVGGHSFNFALGGTDIDSSIETLYFLDEINKLPKKVLLCIDFTNFIIDKNSKEEQLKFEQNMFESKKEQVINKIFSIDALRASMKTLKYHVKNELVNSKIDSNGFLIVKQQEIVGDFEKIQKLTNQYYYINYRQGNVKISHKQLEKISLIKDFARDKNIQLFIMLTPVHENLYSMIQTNIVLNDTLQEFKTKLNMIYPYYDAMILDDTTINNFNFYDAVHYTETFGNLLLENAVNFYRLH